MDAGASAAIAASVASLCTLISVLGGQVFAARKQKRERAWAVADREDAKADREEIKGALHGIANTEDKIHILVNSNFTAQLKQYAAVTRRLARITKDPADEETANVAEESYREHLQAEEKERSK